MPNPYLNEKPYQITAAELKQMTPEQIADALTKGHLEALITPKPDPAAELTIEQFNDVVGTGSLNTYIEHIRKQTEGAEQ